MRSWLVATVLVLCMEFVPGATIAQTSDQVVLRADELVYDRSRNLVTASGNVEVAQGQRILMADHLTYNQQTGTVTASGNVTLLEPSGEVLFAKHIQLDNEMRQGIARDIRLLLTDDSRFAANGAVRTGGNRTELSRAVYSPCRLCPEHPDRPPLWQIKAVRVVHDQEQKDIEYEDVSLEFFGIPVAYSPYLSHPDPTVKRRSGFLTPVFGSSSQLGFTVQVPYHFVLGPHRDATFAPIFASGEVPVLFGEYRQRTETGQFQFQGSATFPERRDESGDVIDGREFRGHIDGAGEFGLGESWRWGFQLERTTDDTYLKRYDFDSADTLTSRLFIEGSRGGGYAAVNGYAFQGLEKCDDPEETPLVLPIADYKYLSEPNVFGGRISLDSSFMSLTHGAGTIVDVPGGGCPTVVGGGASVRRFSLSGGWQRPFLGRMGDIYTLSASMRGDIYWVDDVVVDPMAPAPETFSGITGRFFPRAALDWRYPWIRETGTVRQVIEPMAQIALSPYGGNPGEIPNEDSKEFEFDDTNLFSPVRFPGLDRVDGGPRVTYGIHMGAYGASGGRTTAFIGQSYRFGGDSTFDSGSGLEDNLSDFVGRILVAPSDFFDLSYRFRLGHDAFDLRRSEVDLTGGPEWFRVRLGYLFVDEAPLEEDIGKRQEINVAGVLGLGRNWSLNGRWRRSIDDGQTLRIGGGVTYENECLFVSLDVGRRFITPDRDIGEGTSITFALRLKPLG